MDAIESNSGIEQTPVDVHAALRRVSALERQSIRVAGLLHDEVSQILASAHISLADIAQDVPPSLQVRLQEVCVQLDEVADQLRRVSQELHPSILDDLGLIDAIAFAARTFTRRTGVHVAIEARLDAACPVPIATLVYAFVQEALANVGAHARAASASIALGREGGFLVCAVCDDGVGCNGAATPEPRGKRATGLMLIRDRFAVAGGTLDVASAPGRGTRLVGVIPVDR